MAVITAENKKDIYISVPNSLNLICITVRYIKYLVSVGIGAYVGFVPALKLGITAGEKIFYRRHGNQNNGSNRRLGNNYAV